MTARVIGARILVLSARGLLDLAMVRHFKDALRRPAIDPPGRLIIQPRLIVGATAESVARLVDLADAQHRLGWAVSLIVEEPALRAVVAEVSQAEVHRSLPLALARLAPTAANGA